MASESKPSDQFEHGGDAVHDGGASTDRGGRDTGSAGPYAGPLHGDTRSGETPTSEASRPEEFHGASPMGGNGQEPVRAGATPGGKPKD